MKRIATLVALSPAAALAHGDHPHPHADGAVHGLLHALPVLAALALAAAAAWALWGRTRS